MRNEGGDHTDDKTNEQMLEDRLASLPKAEEQRQDGKNSKKLDDGLVIEVGGGEIAIGDIHRERQQRPGDGKGLDLSATFEAEAGHDVPDASRQEACYHPIYPKRDGIKVAQKCLDDDNCRIEENDERSDGGGSRKGKHRL